MQMNEAARYFAEEINNEVIAALLEVSRRHFESDLVTIEPWRRRMVSAPTPRVHSAWRKRTARLWCGSALAGLCLENDDAGAE